MKNSFILATLLFLATIVELQAQSAKAIIKRIDQNQLFRTQYMQATMVIQKGKRRLVKKLVAYSQSKGNKSFMKFTNVEDRGVKYLKLNNNLWIYFPDADDTMKISGHMLKQGMMGSDLSYEDMLESESLEKRYRYTMKPGRKIRGRKCYVIVFNAIKKNATYAKQILYVDKARYIPLKMEMYAKGGRLIKVMEQLRVKRIGRRFYARRTEIIDKRKKNSKTIFLIQKIRFNPSLPRRIFSKRSLKRK